MDEIKKLDEVKWYQDTAYVLPAIFVGFFVIVIVVLYILQNRVETKLEPLPVHKPAPSQLNTK